MVRSYKLGVNAYVVKPVDFHELSSHQGARRFLGGINEPPPGSVKKAREVSAPHSVAEDSIQDAELIQELLEADHFVCEVTRVKRAPSFWRL